MQKFIVSKDGTFDLGDPIVDHLNKCLGSTDIPFQSFVKLDISNRVTHCDTTAPLIKWNSNKSSGEDNYNSIEFHVHQTQRLEMPDKIPYPPMLWQRNTLGCLIGIISSRITFEIIGEPNLGLQELAQWIKLLRLLGRGSDSDMHWAPLPYLYVKNDGKKCRPLSVKNESELSHPAAGDCNDSEFAEGRGLSFSPNVLKRAFKLLSPIPTPFDGAAWLSKSLDHAEDWVRHIQKFMSLNDLEAPDKFRLLISYAKLEAKSRQIIYGSSVTTHLRNILNTIYGKLTAKDKYDLTQELKMIGRDEVSLNFHYQILSRLSKSWEGLTSSGTCFTCLFRQPEKMLPCGHFTCDRCIQLFGHQISMAEFKFRIDSCVLCNARFADHTFDLEPPSAGVRLLSLDGGGCRAVITIEVLQQLSDALLKLGIQRTICKNFDLCVGTSAGALILLKMLQGGKCNDQLMNEFKNLASRLFQPKKGILAKVAKSLSGSFRTVWTDGWMNTSNFNRLLQEALPKGKFFGGPRNVKDVTKIGVTTVRSDSTACLLANYNGNYYHNNKGYEFLRENDFREEIEVWEACSAGIPGYFQPMFLDQKGAYFDDGGLRYNNPAGLAINESRRIWELPKNLDILLSIGTGFIKSQPAPLSLLRNRSFLRLGRYFLASLCGESTWQHVEAIVTDQYKNKLRRVNIELQNDESSIDDPSVMEPLIKKTSRKLEGSTQITEIANILASSQFYFELDHTITRGNSIRCVGRILSRLDAGSASLIDFTRKIEKSHFIVPGRNIKCAPNSLVLNVVRGAAFERHVKFCIPAIQPLRFDIQFQLGPTEEKRSISGFPANLEFLKTANNISRLRYQFDGESSSKKRYAVDICGEHGAGSDHIDKKQKRTVSYNETGSRDFESEKVPQKTVTRNRK